MKRYITILLILLFAVNSVVCLAEENFLDSAGKFFGDAWNSVSGAASDAWDAASEAAGSALDTAGEAIGQAWTDVSGAAADAWNEAGVFLGNKRDAFSVWMSINGSDALERLNGIYHETTAEMQIDEARANELWLQSMDYADANGIAKVTQAKLTLAVLAYAQTNISEGDIAQAALELIMSSGIVDQTAAEKTLANLLDSSGNLPPSPIPTSPATTWAKRSTPARTTAIPKHTRSTARTRTLDGLWEVSS